MITIKNEINEIAQGVANKEDNVIKNSPHTAKMVITDNWSHPYSREKAVYPLKWVKEHKFWPLKAVIPGGSSVPVLLPDQIDVPASFDGIASAGSMLGSAGIIVMDETTCMVWAAENLLHFYKHESCGKCTPCREGGDWLHRILGKIERGDGQMRDLDLLLSVGNNIVGKSLCAFGDAAATPVLSTVATFRAEYEAHIREGRCTVPAPWRSSSPARVHEGAH
jgi:NADH-quinone oxidoreductase subunit F